MARRREREANVSYHPVLQPSRSLPELLALEKESAWCFLLYCHHVDDVDFVWNVSMKNRRKTANMMKKIRKNVRQG
jgi:hypothetical protein